IASHALQEIRHEQGAVPGRKLSKRFAERRDVVIGPDSSRGCPSPDHPAHTWISGFPFIDDLLKIALDLIDRHTAKGIVDSKLQNEDVDLALQMAGEPFQAAIGGAA